MIGNKKSYSPQEAGGPENGSQHECPVCGKYIFPKKNSYEICPVCGWEDDRLQNDNPDFAGGANKMSLNEAREAYYNEEKDV